jgi:hypothetical protein
LADPEGKLADQKPADKYFKIEVTQRVVVSEADEDVVFYSRRAVTKEKPRVVREKDLREALLILIDILVAAIVPRRYWAHLCHFQAGARLGTHARKSLAGFAESVSSVIGGTAKPQARALFRAGRDARHRRIMLLAGELTRLRWQPRIHLSGVDGLKAALRRGNGVIIWCNQFTAQNLMGKRALHEAGITCHQVSVSEHGFSNSAFARRFLNPFLVRVENRYLASRVVFDRGDAYQVTKRISAILKNNGVVLMTNNVYSGSTFVETRLGGSGHAQFATTPLSFAARGGAALFSMSTFEIQPFETYDAVIGAEIQVLRSEKPGLGDQRPSAKASSTLASAVLDFRDQFEADLRRCPEQYMLWGRQAHSMVGSSQRHETDG